jgi:hypothetical protein
MRGWQALLGSEREVILRQEHSPAQLGLSDFSDATRLGITSTLGRRLFLWQEQSLCGHVAPLAESGLHRFCITLHRVSNCICSVGEQSIMRQIAAADCGGRVLGEPYLPVHCTDVDDVGRNVVEMQPDFDW